MYSLQEISKLADLPARTIRYYIQKGLVDKPDGARKTASYGQLHLEQLMTVKRLSDSGLSLAAIAKVMAGKQPHQLNENDAPLLGEVRVKSHIHITCGVELSFDPRLCDLSQTQLRALTQVISDTFVQFEQEAKK
mgnify:CR=1 FL=1